MTSSVSIQDKIVDSVKQGNFSAEWRDITYQHDGHVIDVSFMSDALIVPEFGRVNVTCKTQQRLADLFNASLLTPFLADILWQNANLKLRPETQTISSSVEAGKVHSQRIDSQISKHQNKDQKNRLVGNAGKHWCLTNQLKAGSVICVNYGMFVFAQESRWDNSLNHIAWRGIKVYKPKHSNSQEFYVIQEPATAHDITHVDYSQTCQLVSQFVKIDGVEYRLSDVLVHDQLGNCFTNTGPLKFSRHPMVPKDNKLTVFFPVTIEA